MFTFWWSLIQVRAATESSSNATVEGALRRQAGSLQITTNAKGQEEPTATTLSVAGV